MRKGAADLNSSLCRAVADVTFGTIRGRSPRSSTGAQRPRWSCRRRQEGHGQGQCQCSMFGVVDGAVHGVAMRLTAFVSPLPSRFIVRPSQTGAAFAFVMGTFPCHLDAMTGPHGKIAWWRNGIVWPDPVHSATNSHSNDTRHSFAR